MNFYKSAFITLFILFSIVVFNHRSFCKIKHYFIVNFPQKPGAVLSFIRDIIGPTDDLVYIQYIKKTNKEEGPALIGIEVASKEDFKALMRRLDANNVNYEYINENDKLFEILI